MIIILINFYIILTVILGFILIYMFKEDNHLSFSIWRFITPRTISI